MSHVDNLISEHERLLNAALFHRAQTVFNQPQDLSIGFGIALAGMLIAGAIRAAAVARVETESIRMSMAERIIEQAADATMAILKGKGEANGNGSNSSGAG